MTDQQPDLSGELSRAEEAATGGIEVRAFLLEIDDDDDQLIDDGEVDGTALDGDDDAVEDDDPAPVEA
jgi:hypothetical protein